MKYILLLLLLLLFIISNSDIVILFSTPIATTQAEDTSYHFKRQQLKMDNVDVDTVYQHPSLELVEITGKGFGYKVKTNFLIKQGELVLRDLSHKLSFKGLEKNLGKARQALAKKLRQDFPNQLDKLQGSSDVDKIKRNEWSGTWINGIDEYQTIEIAFNISKLNHSCQPNVDKACEQDVVCSEIGCYPCSPSPCHEHKEDMYAEVYAIQDIKSGEEVCISYMLPDQLSQTTADRQSYIKLNWHFVCDCIKCSNSN